MKTTFDLPPALLEQCKITAAKQRTTLKSLVIKGLETVLANEDNNTDPQQAMERLDKGFHLGSSYLSRKESHER